MRQPPQHARLLRAGGFTVAALALALLAHRAGGGAAPSLLVFASTAAALLAGAYALAGRPRRAPTIAILVGGSQLGLHAAWQGAGGSAGDMLGCVAHPAASTAATVAMTACHALAAIAVAVLLQRGETWTFAAVRAVRRGARRAHVATWPALRTPGRRAGTEVTMAPPWRRPLAGGRSSCGPPCAA